MDAESMSVEVTHDVWQHVKTLESFIVEDLKLAKRFKAVCTGSNDNLYFYHKGKAAANRLSAHTLRTKVIGQKIPYEKYYPEVSDV